MFYIWAATWENVPLDMCSHRRSDQASHPCSLISLCCPHEETLHPWLSKTRQAAILIRCANINLAWHICRVPTIYVLSRNIKNIRVFCLKIIKFLEVKFSIYLNRLVFVMCNALFYKAPLALQLNVFTDLKLCIRQRRFISVSADAHADRGLCCLRIG